MGLYEGLIVLKLLTPRDMILQFSKDVHLVGKETLTLNLSGPCTTRLSQKNGFAVLMDGFLGRNIRTHQR